MSKSIMVMVLASCISVFNVGCASVYNHYRVQNKIAEKRILASGDKESIRLLNTGLSAREVIKARALAKADGAADGFVISADLLGLGNWFDTFKAEPLETTGFLALDILTGYAINKGYEEYKEDDKEAKVQDAPPAIPDISGNNNSILYINGDGNQTKFDTLQQGAE